MKKNAIFLLAVVLLTACHQSKGPILQTTIAQGEIAGVLEDGYALYMNIPYAEAPLGDLRWKAPVPHSAWDTVYQANHWGNRPPQPFDPNQNGGEVAMSEDCLYLCIGTPATSKNDKLPVFVNIHGGGFLTGYYGGVQANYIKEGIVYCSIEYRMGAFGFMSHPELREESDYGMSGNYGIMDQVCALRWIHDNIAAFGGDPEKITIAGESAGGISVHILSASPECKGLFRGAISESGGSMWPVSDKRNGNTAIQDARSAEVDGLKMQEQLGCANLKEMREADWQAIQQLTKWEGFWPVADGKYIMGDAYKEYEVGRFNDVNVLMGTNSDEGSMFVQPMPVADYEALVCSVYTDWCDRFLEMYPATNEQEAYYSLSDIFRDGSFAWPTYAWANQQTRYGKGKCYMYYFDHCSPNTCFDSPRGGASHVAEMPFAYGWDFGEKRILPEEQPIRDAMIAYWINFTKYQNPNGLEASESLPYWPEYRFDDPKVLYIRNGFSVGGVPNEKQMQLYEAFFAERRARNN